jgi:serine/threonine protein phosphatase PrpC
MHLKLIAADKSDVGKQREQNEDCAYKRVESSEDGDLGLFVVADGMGGYKAGEVASKLAIDTIRERLDPLFKPVPDQPTIKLDVEALQKALNGNAVSPDSLPPSPSRHVTNKLPSTSTSIFVEKCLKSAVEDANAAIVRYGERQSHARGLGSTVTVALVQNDHLYIANVGDSRTYLLRNNVLEAVTKDHSLVAKLIESKQITQEDAYTHPQRNLIYRSLGAGHKSVEVDIFHEVLHPGDKLLLCSDGLWEMVRHQELVKILSEHTSPQIICDKLIERANVCGGEDNITAIVVLVSTH